MGLSCIWLTKEPAHFIGRSGLWYSVKLKVFPVEDHSMTVYGCWHDMPAGNGWCYIFDQS